MDGHGTAVFFILILTEAIMEAFENVNPNASDTGSALGKTSDPSNAGGTCQNR